jgi:monoamine oxidase
MGACFIGPHHDRMHALAKEMGVATFKTFVDGDNVLATGGKVRRYRGDIPRISPLALLSAGQAIARMNAMAKKVPVDAPWDAPRAADWDARSVRAWLHAAHVPTRLARDLIEATVRACFATDPSEVSLLNWLFLVRSAGGIEALMNIAGGYQDAQFEGGVGRIPDAMAADLGRAVVLGAPVTRVVSTADRVVVAGAGPTVSARRVVLALPRALAAGIRFDPVLPADHALLIHQMPAGTELKMVALYDRPFWRDDGVSGATVATDDEIEVTLDTCQPDHTQGVVAGYAAGPRARALAALGATERRAVFVRTLTRRLGPAAASPVEVMEQNWAEEEWTRGCSMGHFPTGVLTQYGRLLREPVGRLHWAGTETATTSYGGMDGAVRSGERVCDEILRAPA